MQIAALVTDDEGHDREPVERRVAQDLDGRVGAPARDGAPDEGLFALPDGLHADPHLELEDETGADRLDDRRRAALLAVLDLGQVAVLEGIDVGDRAAAGHARHPVAEQLASSDEQAGVPGPPMNLWGEMTMASL